MKLTDENKREVMDMAAKGLSKSEIARRLKVSRPTVSKLLIGAASYNKFPYLNLM